MIRLTLKCLFILLVVIGCANNQKHIDTLATQVYSNHNLKDPLPPTEFLSDGCSCWPDSDWVACCVAHDLPYWRGGTREERKQADLKFRQCISEKRNPVLGAIMYYGVRLGGVSWLPTPFRWGFGWEYPQSGPLDEIED